MLTAAQTKALHDHIIDILPDDEAEALSTIALTYASCVVAMGHADETAHEALDIALRQMRDAEHKEVQ